MTRKPLDPLRCYPLATNERRDLWVSIQAWRMADTADGQREAAAEVECHIAHMISDVVDRVLADKAQRPSG